MSGKKLQVQGSMQFRASFKPDSIDVENRTIDVVFATEREVRMYNWSIGRFKEVLVCDDSAGDLTRLNNKAPLLDTHDRSSVKLILGSVVPGTARFENGVGLATVRFSKKKSVDEVWQDVVDGHISGVSVSYDVTEYTQIENADETIPTLRATKWEATEISLAPVQADRDSMVRSENENAPKKEVTIISKSSNSNTMTEEQKAAQKAERKRSAEIFKLCRAANLGDDYAQELVDGEMTIEQARAAIEEKKQAAPATQPEPVDENKVRAAERKRISDIETTARVAGITDQTFVRNLIDNGTPVDQARAAIINKAAESETASPAPQSGARFTGMDETDKLRGGAEIFLMQRSAIALPKEVKPEHLEYAKKFRGMTLLDLAKDCLTRAGVDYRGLDKMEIVGRAFTSNSSDFPVLLEGTTRRILLAAYGIQADTWRKFCMVGSVSDFREHKRLRLGSFSKLDKVGENGEFKTKKITDAEAEGISAETYGNLINVSRKMIINDDLQGFTRLAQDLGRAAARSIEIDVYTLLASNPNMADGTPLFHADHANIGTGGTMSVEKFDEMRVLMASQKDKDGNDFIDIRPSVLLCGIGYGGNAKVINGAQYDPDASNKLQKPNKVFGLFNEIVDTPRITDTKYYAFADPNLEPVIEVAFLDGNQTPFMESRNGFEVDGVEWKVRHDYGVDAIGWKGAVRNAGA